MKKGKAAGGFGKNHGGGDSFKNKTVQSVMSSKMLPKGGKLGK